MKKIDMDNGNFPLAKDALRCLAKTNISGGHRAIIDVIWIETYGWYDEENPHEERIKKRKTSAQITQDVFIIETWMDKSSVSRKIKELVEWRIILRDKNTTPCTYSFNVNVDEWDSNIFRQTTVYRTLNSLQDSQQFTDKTTNSLQDSQLGVYRIVNSCVPESQENQGRSDSLKKGLKKGKENSGYNEPENEKTEGEEVGIMPLLPEPLTQTLERYTPAQQETIKNYWQCIRRTRRSCKLADNIIIASMDKWSKYPAEIVIASMELHISKYPYKREDYTGGIIRRMKEDKEREGNGQEHGQAGRNNAANQRPGSQANAGTYKSDPKPGEPGAIDRDRFKYKRQP